MRNTCRTGPSKRKSRQSRSPEDSFAGAAEWLQNVVMHESDPNRTVAAYMVLAMAQHQLRQADQAGTILAKGLKIAEVRVARLDGRQWNDQMSAHLLMREARTLIDPSSKVSDETK